ncbi:MAG TPA: 4-hydroxybenzoate octaprenyltransferase [Alphaproteobacteria bacterium]|nr:4-hydroxybenzoate octaprenyltransferase [Alphaproteobacteria bacterium]
MASSFKTLANDGTDIFRDNWVDRWLPAYARPYVRLMRLDRPIGTWLLLFPCWWSLAMAWESWHDLGLFILFALGAVIMRGAGCTWNDITDRDYDAKVARTRTRPLPSGSVKLHQAFVFLALQLLAALAILASFNRFAIWLGAASLVVVFAYPLMKRFTYWPQFFLGLAFNWGALLGWAAIKGELAPGPLFLYASGIAWTLGYDTIYAHQDKEDDALVGLKSTALKFGERSKPWLYGFYSAALLLMAASAAAIGLRWPFFAGLGCAALQFFWQISALDTDDPDDCLAKFKSNRFFGWLILGAIVAARAIGPALGTS